MIDIVRGELLKLRKSSGFYGCVIIDVFIIAFGSFMMLRNITVNLEPGSTPDMTGLFAGGSISVLMATSIGTISISSEYHNQTITQSLLTVSNRTIFFLSKLIAVSIVSVIFGFLWIGVTRGMSLIWPNVPSASASVYNHEVLLAFPRFLLAYTLFGLLGVAIGCLVRQQAIALILPFAAILIVGSIVSSLSATIGKFMPYPVLLSIILSPNETSSIHLSQSGYGLLGFFPAILITFFYILVLSVPAYYRLLTDVT